MKEYIERILHQNVQIIPYKEIDRLPLTFRGGYSLSRMIIGGQEVLLAVPAERIPLSDLRKQHRQMEAYSGLTCVLYLKNMNYYARDKMIEEGIPFVWEGHQIYLPFLGALLDDNPRQAIPVCGQISFLTQKLLLTALYQGWKHVTVTKAAEILGVSKMSITRCFDELEAMNIPYLTIRNRARNFSADQDKRNMWEIIRPILRTPVIRTYLLKEEPGIVLPMAGTMALAHFSMLDEERCPIYAFTKKELPKMNVSSENWVPAGEDPGCIVQELGYYIYFQDGKAVDPLTAALSLTEEELTDPRISIAVDEMLEKHVW
ncbi:MAG: hypothetical protein VZR02_04260 [Lachnospiraceae bacterium]|nr:hypothetical protein [Lachnospiraceae bacterium]